MVNIIETSKSSDLNYVKIMGLQHIVTVAKTFRDDNVMRVVIVPVCQIDEKGTLPSSQSIVRCGERGTRIYLITVYDDNTWLIEIRQYGQLTGCYERLASDGRGTIRVRYFLEHDRPMIAPSTDPVLHSYTTSTDTFIANVTDMPRKGFSIDLVRDFNETEPTRKRFFRFVYHKFQDIFLVE
jgi:hypothetical protein